MDKNLKIENEVLIDAPLPIVWDTLINPDKTALYMFGCKAISDWQIGSTLNWSGILEEKEFVFVTGKVLAFVENETIKFTTFDPTGKYEDKPENHLVVTYTLKSDNDKTHLHVCQEGFENAFDGEKRYNEIYNDGIGWQPILDAIKEISEDIE